MSGRRGRIGPTSCQSCRSKKLRCNKTQPCSNCTVRQITCQFSGKQVQPLRSSDAKDIAVLTDRIERLEAMLYRASTDYIIPSNPASNGAREDLQIPEAETSRAITIEAPKSIEHEDVRLLENLGTRNDATLSNFSHRLGFRTQSIGMLIECTVPTTSESNNYSIPLPLYNEALILLQAYEFTVDHVCKVLHIPTVRSLMATWYLALEEGQSVAKGQASLLLAVFALTTFFYHAPYHGQLIKSESDSTCVSRVFTKAALDVLDHCRRTGSGSLEEVQAYILVATVIFYTDGFSARGRALMSTAIATARDLHLHRLDTTDISVPDKRTGAQSDTVDLEIKRRVFWYLASTEWLQATTSGPQEGMYYFQSHHISVEFPRDITNNEAYADSNGQTLVNPKPDGIRFLLERIRLAHICRRIADIMPITSSSLLKLSYDYIMELDQDLLKFLSTLPYFFKTDTESQGQARHLKASYPMLGPLRCLITLTAHSRRCKLHQKFLLLQKTDERYAFSKSACLDSARKIILSFKDLDADCCSWKVMARMGMPLHHLHLAIAVFITEICRNDDAADTADVRAELWDVLQMLESLKFDSPWLPQSLASLRTVLNKYQIYSSEVPGPYVGKSGTRAQVETQSDESLLPEIEHFDSLLNTTETLSYTNEWDSLFEHIDLQYL